MIREWRVQEAGQGGRETGGVSREGREAECRQAERVRDERTGRREQGRAGELPSHREITWRKVQVQERTSNGRELGNAGMAAQCSTSKKKKQSFTKNPNSKTLSYKAKQRGGSVC